MEEISNVQHSNAESSVNSISGSSGFNADNVYIPNNGSVPTEIIGLMLVEPGISLVMSMLYYLCVSLDFSTVAVFLPGPAESNISLLVHAVVINVVFLLVATVWSDYLYIVLIILACIFIFLMHVGLKRKNLETQSILNVEIQLRKNYLPYLGDFRGHLLQMTAISILAVDFEIFPVRFAKTDTYGWSVMDAGVGLFVGAHSICASQARGKSTQSLKKSLWSSIPLLVLGFLRLIAVTLVNYHQVYSEYGIHWNFFFTLALTKMICSTLSFYFPIDSGWLAMALVFLHQWLLSYGGMTEYIQQVERYNFLDANKEGICSLLGFAVIYFGSVKIGKLLWKQRSKVKEYINLLLALLTLWLIGWLCAYILHRSVQPVSRKMANLPYCVWVMSFMCLHIAVHLALHLCLIIYSTAIGSCKKTTHSVVATMKSCTLWKATNYNGLFYFLMANILTGLVNLSMKTSDASPGLSLLVLLTYITILTANAIIMFSNTLQVKFW